MSTQVLRTSFFATIFIPEFLLQSRIPYYAKVIGKRYRPEEIKQACGMVNLPYFSPAAFLVEVETIDGDMEVEVSEKLYDTIKEGHGIFVEYQKSRFSEKCIKGKLLR